MTFSQVMAFGDTPLISSQDEIELAVAMFNPVIAWGTANNVIKIRPGGDYTEEDFSKARDALVKQQKELKWAYDALNAPPVTRRELALAEWNRVFPDIDPTRVLENVKLSGKRLSLIDAYMTGPAYLRLWVSLDNDKELSELLAPRVSQLSSNIDKEFSGKFEEYKRTHEAAMSILFKYHLSLQPKDIQQILQQPGVGFIEVSRPALYGNKLSRHGEAIPIANPTASQLEAVKGRHGLLMKVRGSDGKDSYYSYFPAQAKFVKEAGFPGERTNENDLDYFGGNTDRVPGLYNTYKEFGLTNTEPDPPRDINGGGGTYSSSRAGNLGAMAAKFFMYNYDALKAEAAQATVIDEWNAKRERNKNFALSLIPFYDGIVDAIKGNVAGALFNIGFDIFGFILPGAGAAHKAFKAGKGVLNVIKAAVFSGIGNSFGVTDTANIFKNIGAGVKVGFKGLKYVVSNGPDILSRMKGSYRGYKVGGVYKEGDIVKGFYRSPVDNLLHPVVATFKKGGWYAYNTITKTPFGSQILQFEILDAVIGKPDAQKFKPLTGHLRV
jgi:hypothetical protein